MPEIIDAHQHFWDLSTFKDPWLKPEHGVLYNSYLPQNLQPLLQQAGVTRTIHVQAQRNLDENRWLLSLAEKHDWIAGIVGWVDLTDANVDSVLDEFADHPRFVGVRHLCHEEKDGNWCVRDDVVRSLKTLTRRGLVYDLVWQPMHLSLMPRLAPRVPELKMVIDHLAKPQIAQGWSNSQSWRTDIAGAAQFANVHCKLSGMITEAGPGWTPAQLKPYVHHVIECFGFDRVMYGSDWPVCLLAGSYQQQLDALKEALGPVSEAERRKIFHDNAAAFYGV